MYEGKRRKTANNVVIANDAVWVLRYWSESDERILRRSYRRVKTILPDEEPYVHVTRARA